MVMLMLTADSDAFLFGATCVIKCLRPNSKEPFECYNLSDIEAGLGLKRKHLVKSHCTFCGHPCSKKIHVKSSCEYCITDNNEGCLKKSQGFKCNCPSCEKVRKDKDKKKDGNRWIKVCSMISKETNFPNDKIIEMYMCSNNGVYTEEDPLLEWGDSKIELVFDFLSYHYRSWKPSYIRQQMLPMLSTMYLREMARNPNKTLLVGQYVFHSIQRVKIRYGHQSYVVKWKKAIADELSCDVPVEQSNMQEEETLEVDEEPIGLLDGSIKPQIHVDGCWILTDEIPELVHSAFLEVVKFRQEKELKEMKRRKTSTSRSEGPSGMSELSKPQGVQLSITEFYRTTKTESQAKPGEDLVKLSSSSGVGSSMQKSKSPCPKLSKAVRRRLLFG